MLQGKLFETNDYCLRWVFLNPQDSVYLAGFGERSAAEEYGRLSGYEISSPLKVSMAQIEERQPSVGFSSTPVPQIRPPVAAPVPSPARTAPAIPALRRPGARVAASA